MDTTDAGILIDMTLSMATCLMARVFTMPETTAIFEAQKERLILQGFKEDKIDKLSSQLLEAIAMMNKLWEDKDD